MFRNSVARMAQRRSYITMSLTILEHYALGDIIAAIFFSSERFVARGTQRKNEGTPPGPSWSDATPENPRNNGR